MIKTCVICGKQFSTNSNSKITCSPICSYKKMINKTYEKKRKPKIKKICPVCGKNFFTARQNQIYCSCSCRGRARQPREYPIKTEKPFKLTKAQIAQRERLKKELLRRRMLHEQEKSDFFEGMYYDDESNFTPPLPTQIY